MTRMAVEPGSPDETEVAPQELGQVTIGLEGTRLLSDFKRELSKVEKFREAVVNAWWSDDPNLKFKVGEVTYQMSKSDMFLIRWQNTKAEGVWVNVSHDNVIRFTTGESTGKEDYNYLHWDTEKLNTQAAVDSARALLAKVQQDIVSGATATTETSKPQPAA